jgi:hypothetical protein
MNTTKLCNYKKSNIYLIDTLRKRNRLDLEYKYLVLTILENEILKYTYNHYLKMFIFKFINKLTFDL